MGKGVVYKNTTEQNTSTKKIERASWDAQTLFFFFFFFSFFLFIVIILAKNFN